MARALVGQVVAIHARHDDVVQPERGRRFGDAVGLVRIEGVVKELYDIAILRGVRRPMALGFKTDEIRRTLTVGKMPEAPASGSIH